MDAKAVADRYVTRGGGKPDASAAEIAGDVVTVAGFLLWRDGDELGGGYRAHEAYDAFCRLVNVDRAALRRIVLGPPETGGTGP